MFVNNQHLVTKLAHTEWQLNFPEFLSFAEKLYIGHFQALLIWKPVSAIKGALCKIEKKVQNWYKNGNTYI